MLRQCNIVALAIVIVIAAVIVNVFLLEPGEKRRYLFVRRQSCDSGFLRQEHRSPQPSELGQDHQPRERSAAQNQVQVPQVPRFKPTGTNFGLSMVTGRRTRCGRHRPPGATRPAVQACAGSEATSHPGGRRQGDQVLHTCS